MKKVVMVVLALLIFGGYLLFQNNGSGVSGATASNVNYSYKDGTFTGSSVDAFYGNVQVQMVISGGKITDVQFLDYPQDRSNSVRINTQAMPLLKSEAISVQNAQVNIVSGATATSQAFIQSLGNALFQAKG